MTNLEKLTEATILSLQGKLNEANDKVYLSDREEEAKQFFDSIDFEPLFAKIRELVDDDSIKFSEPQFGKFNYDKFDVDFKSDNLADKCGIMSVVYDKVEIDNFGGGISDDNEGNLFIWVPVHFSFKYKNGGTNGTSLVDATFTTAEGWKFRS